MAGRADLDLGLDSLTRQDREQLYAALIEKRRRDAALFGQYFPDCTNACSHPKSRKAADHGGLCRTLYRQPVAFMDAGVLYDERLFLAANQIGKTQTAAFETVCHLTGRYPSWWRGKRFPQHITAWAAGDTMETTRDILQIALLGDPEGVQTETWNGMLPANLIVKVTRKTGGVPLCVHQIWVRHVDGRNSSLQFKSYDQGRAKFQGAKIQWIWLDEEPPEEPPEGEITPPTIYSECVLRGINCEGQVVVTFTPLRGATPFLLGYLDGAAMLDEELVEKPAKDVLWSQDNPAPETSKATMGNDKPVKLVVGATWDDAPHLTAEKRDKLWKSMPAYLRDARTKGIPTLGAGAIYPFGEADIKMHAVRRAAALAAVLRARRAGDGQVAPHGRVRQSQRHRLPDRRLPTPDGRSSRAGEAPSRRLVARGSRGWATPARWSATRNGSSTSTSTGDPVSTSTWRSRAWSRGSSACTTASRPGRSRSSRRAVNSSWSSGCTGAPRVARSSRRTITSRTAFVI